MATTHDDEAGTGAARGRRGRPPVPPERILATALLIVDEEGADALSMRALAQRLGSGTATLYRHFDDRAALVAGIADRLYGEIDVPAGTFDPGTDWREACRALALAMFDTLARHRNVAPLLVGQTPTGPHATALRERHLTVLLGAGFSPATAARAHATLSRHVLGFAVQLTPPPQDAPHEPPAPADPRRLPATAAVADVLPIPLEEEFAFGLDLILGGLSALRDTR
ncbi:TetR/AcrR family transcriptional regulator C-terminal domain-containing protein [Actinocorallia sp. API 0066]|uniref:TetR/AcrR family transcriptional regulator n=1 Tax=Actinocorallia sp. API 0066 TaxID=2896846 RepID=UPI001E3BDC4B|nr:TetR/AcrR family transcriptional regulator C-terminal domain-containing protein [Actinocorallia sp. API 0066]MCD0449703.1 TetR/AcrR family transcriptional regulator C-terminal domain-containing protein [Actinocorallia sp. API 0066]